MDNTIHFISGLPRSGSTLLVSILNQNPRFHTGPTSPLANLFMAVQKASSRVHESSIFLDEEQKIRLLRGLFSAYYHATLPDTVLFNKSRAWAAKLPALARLFPAAKLICCVRDVSWIMDSFERLFRSNPFDLSRIFDFEPASNVFTRIHYLAVGDGIVGFAINSLRDAFFGEQADRLILVSYEALTQQPENTMRKLYEFLGEEWFPHDFDNVAYQTPDHDGLLGTPHLHTVRRRVAYTDRTTLLPPELFKRLANDNFWLHSEANIRNVPILLPEKDSPFARSVAAPRH